jgi:hypothetical protein
MNLKKTSVLLLASLCLPSISYATDSNNAYAIKGAGIAKCSKFIEFHQKKSDVYLVFGGWLEGYLTAANQQQPKTFDLAPWQSTQLLLVATESLCKQKPDMQFQEAVQVLIGQLAQQKIAQGGKFITIDQYVFQEEVIKRIKIALKSRGLYSGDVSDSKYDEKLRAAVKQFQKGIKQTETGIPDQGTLYELFKPQK